MNSTELVLIRGNSRVTESFIILEITDLSCGKGKCAFRMVGRCRSGPCRRQWTRGTKPSDPIRQGNGIGIAAVVDQRATGFVDRIVACEIGCIYGNRGIAVGSNIRITTHNIPDANFIDRAIKYRVGEFTADQQII